MTNHTVNEASSHYQLSTIHSPFANVVKQVPVGYKQTEVGVIPEDWEFKSIGEIASVFSGGTPNRKIAEYWDGDIPWVTTTLIDGGDITSAREFITQRGLDGSSTKWCNAGTILLAMYGQGKTRGKAALLCIDATINQACAAIELKDASSSQYILHILNSMYEDIRELSNSGGQENLSGRIIKSIQIPLPPQNEQTAIANALSDVDALISELEKLIAKKQAIKTATMQQLLTGRTRLPQFARREDGATTNSFGTNLDDGTGGSKGEGQDGLRKGTKQSELGEIPEDWEVKTYGEVFTFLSTSTNSRADLSEEGDYGYVHYGDIHLEWNNRLDLNEESLPGISRDIVSSAFVMDGDLIMADASEDYEGIGKSVEVFNVGDKKLVAGLHTFLLRDKDKVLADGFRGYLHSIPAVKSTFDRLATGMKVYGISKNNLSTVCIPVPSRKEQTAIATILSDMDEEIQALEQRLSKTRQIKQGMMQELLTGKTRLIQRSEAV